MSGVEEELDLESLFLLIDGLRKKIITMQNAVSEFRETEIIESLQNFEKLLHKKLEILVDAGIKNIIVKNSGGELTSEELVNLEKEVQDMLSRVFRNFSLLLHPDKNKYYPEKIQAQAKQSFCILSDKVDELKRKINNWPKVAEMHFSHTDSTYAQARFARCMRVLQEMEEKFNAQMAECVAAIISLYHEKEVAMEKLLIQVEKDNKQRQGKLEGIDKKLEKTLSMVEETRKAQAEIRELFSQAFDNEVQGSEEVPRQLSVDVELAVENKQLFSKAQQLWKSSPPKGEGDVSDLQAQKMSVVPETSVSDKPRLS